MIWLSIYHQKIRSCWLEGYTLPRVDTDFNAAMKGKRTIATLRDAADNEVARAKIAINEAADLIRTNAKIIAEAGYEFLFADRQQLVTAEPAHLKTIVSARIAEHKEKERQKEEAHREQIRREEQAKAEAEAKRKADEEAEAQRQQLAAAEQQATQAQPQKSSSTVRHQPVQTEAKSEEPAQYAATERPTDNQILAVIGAEWGVSMEVAADWVLAMNTDKLQEMQAA